MANKMNSTKVVTGVVRLSYANVWEPASINGSNPKYSVSLIIPKSDKQTIDAINAQDYPIFMLTTCFYTAIGLVANLVVDISYGFIDPRIRMGSKK